MIRITGLVIACSVMLLAAQTGSVSAADVSADLLAGIKAGDAEAVGKLLAGGADPNARIEGGMTALIAAAYEGNGGIVKLLLDKGADVNVKTDQGMTALIIAAAKGHQEVVKALLAKGADANMKEASGFNAFQIAVAAGHQGVADMLKPRTKVTATPTTKTVVDSLDQGQSCLQVMNFPNETMKKIRCLHKGEAVDVTGVFTNNNWSLIQKPVLGWVPSEKLKQVTVTEEPPKPVAKKSSSGGEGLSEFSEVKASSAPERTEKSPEETLFTGGGGGEWWRGR
jgi:uncharacterized protein